MLYLKNIPTWERAARVIGAFIGAGISYSLGMNIILAILILSFSLTGFLGFCPVCAMFGRKLQAQNPKDGI